MLQQITEEFYKKALKTWHNEKRAWSRSKSLSPVTTLVQITQCTSPNYTDHPQVNIHCIENIFTVQDF